MSSDKVVIRRALLGVADKSGLAEFAKMLARHGVEILSTGGTMAALEAAGGMRPQGGRLSGAERRAVAPASGHARFR